MTSAAPLRELLLQFQQSPGQFNIALRQPAALFASLREVLQIAIGRDGAAADDVQAAACFFVRAALLHPTADHYALLGLTSGADAAAVKERYRLMMRLLHPDFAGRSGQTWPADTAARVNLAYEVLSDPERRHTYDLSRPEPAAAPPDRARAPLPVAVAPAPSARRASWRHTSRAGLKTLTMALAAIGGGLAVLALAPMGRDSDYLVQRPRGPAPAPSGPADERPRPSAVAELPPQAEPPMPVAATAVALPPAPAEPAPVAPVATAAEPVKLAAAPLPVPTPAAPPVAPVATAAPAPTSPPVLSAEPPGRVATGKITEVFPPEPPPPAAALASPSLAEAQPLLARVLHSVENARGEALVSIVEREGRQNLATQGLARQIDALGGGVKVTSAQFKSEPADGRLVVTGQMRVDTAGGQPGRRLTLRMEFASRAGAVVLTGLSGGWTP